MTEISPAELVESTLQQAFPTLEERSRWVRNNRIVLGASALVGITTGFIAGHTLLDLEERNANTENVNDAAGYEQCVEFIEQQLKPGDTTITLKLGSIARQQQIDCGVDDLAELIESTRTNSFDDVVWKVGGNVSTLEAAVTLSTVAEYEAKIADLKDDAEYSSLSVGLQTGGTTLIGAMGGFVLGMQARGMTMRNARKRNSSKN